MAGRAHGGYDDARIIDNGLGCCRVGVAPTIVPGGAGSRDAGAIVAV